MSNKYNKTLTFNFSWLTFLGVVLILGKAFGYVTLPWFWVLLPLMIPVVIVLGMLLMVGMLVRSN